MAIQSIPATVVNSNQLFPQTLKTNLNQISAYLPNSSSSFLSQSNSLGNNSVNSQNILLSQSILQYQNQDGDSVTLSSESMQYQETSLSASGNNSKEDWQKVVDYLKSQYSDLKDGIMKSFLKDKGISLTDNTTTPVSTNNDIKGLPDYWNAENTSQRIVDFATSFYGMFKGSGSDFVSMMKDAIDKGFSMANDTTGDLPDAVSKLVGNTHDLAMQKLDDWAKQQGITVDQTQNEQTTSQAA